MIRTEGRWFKDEQGRTMILRGVNLGGSNKVPWPNGASHIREGFFDHRTVSFVGRPFPLAEADEHFARLRAWGFTFLRFLVTWEAIEHAGPGIYDEAYLDYLSEVVRKAGEHDLALFIDPHQDAWGRLSGGDGAPGWTFEVVGMDATRFHETGAALVHALHGDPFPRMIWPTNYTKLATATMFTLFFGGSDFAPQTQVNGEPVQEYLQRHYIAAMRQVALRLRGLSHVIGYDTMNEPSPGFIGWADLEAREPLPRGAAPTPFQSMLLGAGLPQEVERWDVGLSGPRRCGSLRLNPDGARAWREGIDCVWRQNGVWDLDAEGRPRLLRPDHFTQVDGRPVNFADDYLRPFLNRYARQMRAVDPGALMFVEGEALKLPPHWGPEDAPNVVHAAHWYDGLTLYRKDFTPYLGADYRSGRLVIGRRAVRRMLRGQLAAIREEAAERMGDVPVLIGEFGIPFDMRGGEAYRTGDFSRQVHAMDASFQAVEANLLSATLWDYTADNDNQRGDQWNGEDLSLFSRDQQRDPADVNSGGRALQSAVRPYARRVAGEPLRMAFDPYRSIFEFTFRHDPAVAAPTEIFVPAYHYPHGARVELSDGEYELDLAAQVLVYRHGDEREIHTVRLRRQPSR